MCVGSDEDNEKCEDFKYQAKIETYDRAEVAW